jgi:hypothetical protein
VVISFCRALLKEVKGDAKARPITKILGKGYVEPERIAPLLEALITELEEATAQAEPQTEIASAASTES